MLKYGPNNQFLCLMQCAKLAKDTHRTLVLPVLQAWQNDLETQQHVWPFEQVFDAGRLRGYVRVASLAEFIRRTGGVSSLQLLCGFHPVDLDGQRELVAPGREG